jgi:hypothetical protein
VLSTAKVFSSGLSNSQEQVVLRLLGMGAAGDAQFLPDIDYIRIAETIGSRPSAAGARKGPASVNQGQGLCNLPIGRYEFSAESDM